MIEDVVERIATRLWQTSEGADDSSGWATIPEASKNFWRGYASDVSSELMIEEMRVLLADCVPYLRSLSSEYGGETQAPDIAALIREIEVVIWPQGEDE